MLIHGKDGDSGGGADLEVEYAPDIDPGEPEQGRKSRLPGEEANGNPIHTLGY